PLDTQSGCVIRPTGKTYGFRPRVRNTEHKLAGVSVKRPSKVTCVNSVGNLYPVTVHQPLTNVAVVYIVVPLGKTARATYAVSCQRVRVRGGNILNPQTNIRNPATGHPELVQLRGYLLRGSNAARSAYVTPTRFLTDRELNVLHPRADRLRRIRVPRIC